MSKLQEKLLYKNRFAKIYFHRVMQNRFLRNALINLTNSMNFKSKNDLYNHAKEYLRKKQFRLSKGSVHIKFNKAQINIPVQEGLNHNIGRVFAILGHDQEIKETYIDLINNDTIKCFYDVGSNYGHHSLLMLSQNIKVYSFEPNPTCHSELFELAKFNNYENFVLIKDGVGSEKSKAQLIFPKNSTWLGKVDKNAGDTFNNTKDEVIRVDIDIITLDDFSNKEATPELIKIDTEGFEVNVLNGASKLIDSKKPYIIFESLGEEKEVFLINDFMISKNYLIYELPLNIKSNPIVNFNKTVGIQANYLASPKEKEEIIHKIISQKV